MRVCSLCQRCYDDPVAYCTEEGHPSLYEIRGGNCDLIAGYRLEFLLGATGNSDTYRARQTHLGRNCLVRIVDTRDGDADRLQHEMRIASSFFHPGVVAVYEAGTLDTGEVYIVTEDAGGYTLRDLLNNDSVPSLVNAIVIAHETAEALHALHLSGLTHGAINPENIALTTTEPSVVIKLQNLDLGDVCGRSIASEKILDGPGLYSLRYFSPEQSSGDAAGPQSDVYSLGVVLYEMLAGQPPFDGHTPAALIDAHKNQRPPDLRIDNFELRMLLTHTVMEALEKGPSRRQSSANALARQLRQIEQLATHSSSRPPAEAISSDHPSAVSDHPSSTVLPPAQDLSNVKIPRRVPMYNEELDPAPQIRAVADNQVNSGISQSSSLKKRFSEALAQLGVFGRGKAEPEIKPIQFKVIAAQIPDLIAQNARLTAAAVDKKEPTKVKWETPDDDIPLGTEAPIAMPSGRPLEIEWETLDDDIPSATEEPVAIPPRRPAEIEWVQPIAAQTVMPYEGRPSQIEAIDDVYSPTILGERYRPRASKINIEPYAPPSRSSYRPVIIGSGVAALAVLGLFGPRLIERYAPAQGSSGRAAVKNVPPQKPAPPLALADPVSPVQKSPAKIVTQSPEQDVATIAEVVPAKMSPPPREKPVRRGASRYNPNIRTVSMVIPSTLVIYSDNGIIRSRIEPEKKTSNVTERTRPRTVKDPFR